MEEHIEKSSIQMFYVMYKTNYLITENFVVLGELKAIKSDPHICCETDVMNPSPVSFGHESNDDANVVFSDSYDGSLSNSYVYKPIWTPGPRIKELSPDLHSTSQSPESYIDLSDSYVNKVDETRMSESIIFESDSFKDVGKASGETTDYGTSVDHSYDLKIRHDRNMSDRNVSYSSRSNTDNDQKNHMIERHKHVKMFMEKEFPRNGELTPDSNINSIPIINSITKCDKVITLNKTSNALTNLKGMFNKSILVDKPQVSFSTESSDIDYQVSSSTHMTSSSSRTPTGILIKHGHTHYRRSISADPVASGETVLPSVDTGSHKYSDENFPMKVTAVK